MIFLCLSDQLDPNTFPHGRIWLFGFNSAFSSAISFAWETPPKGLASKAVPKWAFLYCASCHFDLVGGSGTCWQQEDYDTCPSCWCHGPDQKRHTTCFHVDSHFLQYGGIATLTDPSTGNNFICSITYKRLLKKCVHDPASY